MASILKRFLGARCENSDDNEDLRFTTDSFLLQSTTILALFIGAESRRTLLGSADFLLFFENFLWIGLTEISMLSSLVSVGDNSSS